MDDLFKSVDNLVRNNHEQMVVIVRHKDGTFSSTSCMSYDATKEFVIDYLAAEYR